MTAMVPFYTRFRELAFREMRSVTIRGERNLPDGEYGFLELYCDDPKCDCRRVLIDVVTPTTGSKIWATINYGWESLEFYEKWMGNKESARESCGATLDMLNPQTEYSPVLLALFKWVLQDQAYVERLKRHYRLFKSDLRAKRKSATRSSRPARRRR
ncbi:MAG: hypothetical protein FJ009_13880 [Chloroflexi bacterium]|nr:hypothetical protein [Chloroflexota bacterium]